jgi:hypothetical protein
MGYLILFGFVSCTVFNAAGLAWFISSNPDGIRFGVEWFLFGELLICVALLLMAWAGGRA